MQVSNVTKDDAAMAAELLQLLRISVKLIDALRLAGIEITGPGIDSREASVKWLRGVSKEMVSSLSLVSPVSSSKKEKSNG